MGPQPGSGAAYATPPSSSRKRKAPAGSHDNPIDLDGPSYRPSSGRAPTPAPPAPQFPTYLDGLTGSAPETPKKQTKRRKADGSGGGEKRLRRFRPQPPQAFHDVFARATSQRFYILSRTRCGTATCPEEMLELAGSTGNVYTVCVAEQPTCDCPHAQAGNKCKHVLYVLSRVLRARFDLVYQLALLPSELCEIFASAPPIDTAGEAAASADNGGEGGSSRKPIEGDCPICFTELESGKPETIVWCRAACGQNIHKECLEMWAATKRQGGGRAEVTCPYCRSIWQGDKDMVGKITRVGKLNGEGYVNVADQLGISTVRDESSYSPWLSYHRRRRYQYY